jgi:hypothetical protein
MEHRALIIQRAPNGISAPPKDMCIDLRGFETGVAEQLLDGSNVASTRQAGGMSMVPPRCIFDRYRPVVKHRFSALRCLVPSRL